MAAPVPELEGLSDAEEFFEALGVAADPAVLAAHRLAVLRLFGMVSEAWLDANPDADPAARRAALAGALREAHDAFAEGEAPSACDLFGERPVTLTFRLPARGTRPR